MVVAIGHARRRHEDRNHGDRGQGKEKWPRKEIKLLNSPPPQAAGFGASAVAEGWDIKSIGNSRDATHHRSAGARLILPPRRQEFNAGECRFARVKKIQTNQKYRNLTELIESRNVATPIPV
jgi:hypothetical protein